MIRPVPHASPRTAGGLYRACNFPFSLPQNHDKPFVGYKTIFLDPIKGLWYDFNTTSKEVGTAPGQALSLHNIVGQQAPRRFVTLDVVIKDTGQRGLYFCPKGKWNVVIEPINIGVVCRTCGNPITTRDTKKAAVLSALPAQFQALMRCPGCSRAARQAEEVTTGRVDYHTYIRSPQWRRKAEEAKERAGWRCQVCNDKKQLQAHHRSYQRLGDEPPEDITVLCDECHELFSREGKLK